MYGKRGPGATDTSHTSQTRQINAYPSNAMLNAAVPADSNLLELDGSARSKWVFSAKGREMQTPVSNEN